MRYKVYYKGDKIKVYNTNVLYSLNMDKVSPSKHREEIEEYLGNMNEPTLVDNGDGTVTLKFDPIPEEMATWMIESKTVFFNIVRKGWGNINSNYHRHSKHTVSLYFPYSWEYPGIATSIPNTVYDMANRIIQTSELTSGSITRDISHIYDFEQAGHYTDMHANCSDWVCQFYIGLIYFNSDNLPTLYKMDAYNYYPNE